MPRFDLCLAWNWEFDRDFVSILTREFAGRGLTFLGVNNQNLDACLAETLADELTFNVFYDRASESDARFLPLADLARRRGNFRVNPREQADWASDKATMHLEFISRGLDTPHTILLPPCEAQADLPPIDLSPLGGRFAIKPASLGGGEGVVLEATTFEQVLTTRRQHPGEKYLLQAQVTPILLGRQPAWFRVLVCDGAVYPCWWDPQSHVYIPLRAEEKLRHHLQGLSALARRIALICGLHLFSTEICQTSDGRLLVVDYVNDPVDMRLQSAARDGVPDGMVQSIAARIVRLAERNLDNPPRQV
jgi:hypothetical protein